MIFHQIIDSDNKRNLYIKVNNTLFNLMVTRQSQLDYLKKVLDRTPFMNHLFKNGDFEFNFTNSFGKDHEAKEKIIILIYDYDHQQFVNRHFKIPKQAYDSLKMMILKELFQMGSHISYTMKILKKKFEEMQKITHPEYQCLESNMESFQKKLMIQQSSQYALIKNKISPAVLQFFKFFEAYEQYTKNKFKNSMFQNLLAKILLGYAPDRSQILKDFQNLKFKLAEEERLLITQLFQYGILQTYGEFNPEGQPDINEQEAPSYTQNKTREA